MCEENTYKSIHMKILSSQYTDLQIKTAYEDIRYYFMDIYNKNEFFKFDYDTLKNVLSSDNLNIDDEKIVLGTIKKWLENKMMNPEKNLHTLLDVVRLHVLPLEYLWDELRACLDDKCFSMFLDAIQYKLFPDKRFQLNLDKFRNRKIIHKFLSVGSWIKESCGIIEIYDTSSEKWIHLKNYDIRRKCYAAVILNDTLMIIGGDEDDKTIHNTVDMINLATGRLTSGPPMLEKRSKINALVVGESNPIVYVIGGFNTSSLTSCEKFDPITQKWTLLPSMPNRRANCGCAHLNGIIYTAGGRDGTTNRHSMDAYNIKLNIWESKKSMNEARSYCRIVASTKYLYAMGGYYNDFSQNPKTSVERYDPNTNTWMMMASLTSPGGFGGICSYGINKNKILFVGGANNSTSTVEYDEETNTWKTLAPLNFGRDGAIVLEIPRKLLKCRFEW